MTSNLETSFINRFMARESSSGIMLVLAALLALVMANTPLDAYYKMLIDTPVVVSVGTFKIAKPLLLWINDGLMASFFFLVGLELKREFMEGSLSEPRNIILPGLGAVGGMAIPALVYLAFNHTDPVAVKGWAIPAATDIAFALGVLSLLGSRAPISLKIFLTSLAIFDDVGAILIIAFFYTSKISLAALIGAACCIIILSLLNFRGYSGKSMYILVGSAMWVALLKSGIHATLAGVLLALFIPMRAANNPDVSPLKSLENDLHTTVAFAVLPIFAFCNSGLNLTGVGLDALSHPVPMGIALGLFLGKQVGVFAACFLGVKLGIAKLPSDISMPQLYGVSVLTGIGFTMSLFIGGLAFEETGVNLVFDERLGIILGSLLSGVMGYLILRHVKLPTRPEGESRHE